MLILRVIEVFGVRNPILPFIPQRVTKIHPQLQPVKANLPIEALNSPREENLPRRIGLKRNDSSRIPVGARLFRFRTAWKGAHHESIVSKGLSWSWLKTPPPPQILDQVTTPEQDIQLVKMRRKRVIEKAKVVKFQSRIFTVPKKDSSEGRMILDLSILNTHIK